MSPTQMPANFAEWLEFELFTIDQYSLKLYQILLLVTVILLAKFFIWLSRVLVYNGKVFKEYDPGQASAYHQIIKYFIIVTAIAAGLEALGIKITFLLAGSAALLVGIGLGLQQLFNDLVCGFIILSEHSIKVNDIIEIEGEVSQVKRIGLRTSIVETRDGITIIMPNSKIVNEKVTNWSHNKQATRFKVTLGVAYGSNVDLVSETLLKCAARNKLVEKTPGPFVRFIDFGNSSLDFELYFWTVEKFRIEEVKSQLRFQVNRAFIENKIQIPFPQRDLHIRSGSLR